MVRKLFENESNQLEIKWSDEGIHFELYNTEDETMFSFLLEKDDIFEFKEDVNFFEECIKNANKQ